MVDVSAPAHLEAEGRAVGDLHQPHAVTILVAEEGQCAALYGGLIAIFVLGHAGVLSNLLVDKELYIPDLFVGHLLHVAEVEAQPVRGDQRACLPDVRSQDLPQRGVQQVGRRVVPGRVLPAYGINV